MNLRFWEWDRVFNLAVLSLLFALGASLVLMTVPYPIGTDGEGNEVLGTIWDELTLLGALLLVGLPILIAVSPLTVLSRAGGIGKQQLINLWLSFGLLTFVALVIDLFFFPAAVFELSAAVAATVRGRSNATGKTAGKRPPGESKRGGMRMSEEGRKRARRRGGGR